MVRSGAVPDEKHRLYFLAIGRPIGESRKIIHRFTVIYSSCLPLMIAVSGFFGWLLAGRALEPVNSVSVAAQQITGSNLNLQIPLRGAGDELDHLIDTFNRMIERLNNSFQQIRQFSTDVSHELRTPLTAIRGQLEVALFTAKTTEQYKDAMVNALQDVEQLSNIVRALLLLSQAESGQLALQMAPLNLSAIVEDIVDQFQIPAEAENVSLSAELSRECNITADRTQMERLLSNLLSNAIKYTPGGGRVWVRLRCEDGQALLEVEDTGLGIPEDQLPHIFDRFYRVRSANTNPIQGLGLGLSFVSWIVRAHGGAIDVTSTVGKGSRFTVSLPLAETAPHALEPAVEIA
jgi:heavy metal sensor kinase